MGITSLNQKSKPDFWRNLRVGDMITIQDQQAIEDSIEDTQLMRGTDHKIEKIQTIQEADDLATWILYNLSNKEDLDMRLVAKIVDENVALSVVTEIDGFEPNTKQALLEEENYWLFEEPEDPDNFDLDDLCFNQAIIQENGEAGQEYEFLQKSHGTMFGESTYEPEEEGIDGMFTSISEYSCNTENVETPELLILEEGEDEDEGGFISVFAGNNLGLSEIEVLGQ